MDWNSLTTIVSILAAAFAIYFGLIRNKREENTETKQEGMQSATLFSDVGYIKSGIDDLKRKQEKADDRYIDLAKQITAIDESVKSAHKRIDCIEK